MRFLTVDYRDKQETYGTCCSSADTGNIALDILNIPDYLLGELLELTEPMMQLVDFLNKNRNPDSSTLAMMLTASKNAFRVVDMVRIEPERVKKKNAAAIYRYQADCDGAWGEIHFDFEKKRIHIKRLAEWDTMKSHIYAWKVICFVALSGVLPKKKRIVFERE